MAKVYLINCRDAVLIAAFRLARPAHEVMEFCAEHAIHEHDMKAFGTELYLKMRRCLKTMEEENA